MNRSSKVHSVEGGAMSSVRREASPRALASGSSSESNAWAVSVVAMNRTAINAIVRRSEEKDSMLKVRFGKWFNCRVILEL